MKQRQWFYFISAILLISGFIFPFLYIFRFTYLSGDDFCRATTEFSMLFSNLLEWYNNQNGRFINALFGYLPIYDLRVYRIVLALFFITLGFSLYFFLKKSCQFYSIKLTHWEGIYMSCIFFILLISQLPSLYEFFYWYAGSTAYLLSVVFLLCLMGILLNNNWKSLGKFLVTVLLVIIINGNNEILIPLVNFFLLLAITFFFIRKRKLNVQLLLLNLVSWLSSYAVIYSPGSTGRQKFYPEGGDFWYSLKSAVFSSGMFSIKSLVEFPMVFLYLGIFLFFYKRVTVVSTNFTTFHPLVLGMFSLLALTSVLFVPYFAIGHLNVNEGRIGNMAHVIMTILLLFNIINSAIYFKTLSNIKAPDYLDTVLLLFFLVSVLFTNRNYRDLIYDFNSGGLIVLKEEMTQREEYLKKIEGPRVEINEISGTKIIKNYGASNDDENWINLCYLNYINKAYKRDFKKILVE